MLMISNFQISLGLQVLRERSKMSPQDLAITAGLPPDEVSRIEAGEIGLDYLTAARLTQVLRVGLAEIATAAHALDPKMVRDRYEQMSARSHGSQGQIALFT
ncbi:helix-turn-helix transcriptional regulator [Massilia sp. Dwa41.01b]|uniref:helix-turn-helix domain-containing protein n=1 Tax=unclassified Massilia TaxID=2609279 RepID=UPI0016013692|nr:MULTISPECIES: helix-turn-helix transcriptional regulator [unclassified Massilia]QNA88872.1 helix-turn-helix transcriptional regulator [Massilia sp. Dwa41.01b]QNA99765.1 helix-turn-helix transcriptional regulator [Massilia sp. Se16.2.3]